MDRIKKFEQYVNEDLNITRYDNGLVRFEDRYFYYNPEDEIIYGTNEKPAGSTSGSEMSVNGVKIPFWFNPTERTYNIGGATQVKKGDLDDNCVIFAYDLYSDKVYYYDESLDDEFKVSTYLKSIGVEVENFDEDIWFSSKRNRDNIQYAFEQIQDNVRHILVWGDQLVASTFDVIEEN